VCEYCGGNIKKQRLMAIPFTSLCVKCKEAEERTEGFEGVEEEISNVMDDEDIEYQSV
jgi:RNA polymerase-binding transcription factor DksA